MVTFEDVKRKAMDAKDWTGAKLKDAKAGISNFCHRHPTAAAIIGTTLLSGTVKIVRDVHHDHRVKKEEDRRDSRIYDRNHDIWLETKRPLKNSEKVILAERHKTGESKYDILRDMRLLK